VTDHTHTSPERNAKEITMSRTQKQPVPAPTAASNRPVHTIRHRRLKATIWRNDTDKGPMFNVTLVRSYRDENEEWKDSHSLGYDDLMNVAALMYEAHAFISSLHAELTKTRPRAQQ
jgi:hypothetical protein